MEITLFFVAHFIADFLCQPRDMAQNKSKDVVVLFQHGVIVYMFTALVGIALLLPYYIAICNVLIHMTIDWYIWRVYKKYSLSKGIDKYWEDENFYRVIGLDQLLHYLTLIFLLS